MFPLVYFAGLVDFETAFVVIRNISLLEFNLSQWQTIVLGYQNVFIVMLIGYLWHFMPEKLSNFLRLTFGKLPIVLKAIVLALAFWVVCATATSGPQPFIYFQF